MMDRGRAKLLFKRLAERPGSGDLIELRLDRNSPARRAAYERWFSENRSTFGMDTMEGAKKHLQAAVRMTRYRFGQLNIAKNGMTPEDRKRAVWVLKDDPHMLERIAIESTRYDSACEAIACIKDRRALETIARRAIHLEAREAAREMLKTGGL